MIKKYLMVLVVTFLSVTSTGCATMPASEQEVAKLASEQEVAKYVANFDYTPDSQGAPGLAGVTFAIGNVNYIPSDIPFGELWMQELVSIKKVSNGKLVWSSFSQFDSLNKAIKEDLSEILLAKGFGVRGPFDSYDLIPYSDKKAIDLYLVSALELSFMLKDEKWTEIYYSTGNVEVSGKITLALREIVTGELMWTKSIPLEKFDLAYRIRGPYRVERKFNPIMNEVAKGIEQQYLNLMATISKLIDPEEMQIIKKQCQELKNKKGY